MSISPARIAAFEVLNRIERDRAFSSYLLPQVTANLSPQDRRLCYEISLGVLRNQVLLDRVISDITRGRKIDREVAIVLRIGIYQLRFLDRIPDYSAISESVNLVQRAKKTSAKAFVNAVLRKYQKAPPDLSFADDLDRISVTTSHPPWLIEKWAGDLGMERAETLASSNNEQPESAFRFLESSGGSDELLKIARPSLYVDDCYLTDRPASELRQFTESGAIYLQSEASQMTARSIELAAGDSFLDVCASPGGKTGLIGRRYAGQYRRIIAGDLYRQRVEHLRQNCIEQFVDKVSVIQYDAVGALPFAERSFDRVLVDAPCSGTGTIRRNPEIRYFLKLEDLALLSAKQLAILSNASKLVRKGGSIVYSTCSFEPEENERVCEAFLRGNADFVFVLPKVNERFATPNGFARTWPDRDGMDGFFIASFVRN